MAITASRVKASLLDGFANAEASEQPYKYWIVHPCLPAETLDLIAALPFEAPPLDGVSGKREAHNATRKYFDVDNRSAFDVVSAISGAFQDADVTTVIAQTFGTSLEGSYLRIEYAQDVNGFWLEPHTDLGVKLFTMLLYLSDGPGHEKLGTNIYDTDKIHVGRSPFEVNTAMIFVPSDITFHGFEERSIEGVRRSLIINYVTDEWRAREQLAFPDAPIAA